MSYGFCVKHQLTMTLREIERGKTIYICSKCEQEQREIMRKITSILLLAVFCLPAYALPFHHSKVDKAFVTETVAELKDAALFVGRYERLHHSMGDVMYIQRAEADLSAAVGTLSKYRHHSAAKQDVEGVMSQLSRDLEDTPPPVMPEGTIKPMATA